MSVLRWINKKIFFIPTPDEAYIQHLHQKEAEQANKILELNKRIDDIKKISNNNFDNYKSLEEEYKNKIAELQQENKELALAKLNNHAAIVGQLEATRKELVYQLEDKSKLSKYCLDWRETCLGLKYENKSLESEFESLHKLNEQAAVKIIQLERELAEAKKQNSYSTYERVANKLEDLNAEHIKLINKYDKAVHNYNNFVDKNIALTGQLEDAEQEIKILRAKEDCCNVINDRKERDKGYEKGYYPDDKITFTSSHSFIEFYKCNFCKVLLKYHDRKHCELIKGEKEKAHAAYFSRLCL